MILSERGLLLHTSRGPSRKPESRYEALAGGSANSSALCDITTGSLPGVVVSGLSEQMEESEGLVSTQRLPKKKKKRSDTLEKLRTCSHHKHPTRIKAPPGSAAASSPQSPKTNQSTKKRCRRRRRRHARRRKSSWRPQEPKCLFFFLSRQPARILSPAAAG